jgi:hypothetical protein
MVNVLGQTERVREFLSSTARSERGGSFYALLVYELEKA